MMVGGTRQHAGDDIGGTDALGTFDGSKASHLFDGLVDILSVDVDARIVAMDDDVDAMSRDEGVEELRSDGVRDVCDDLIDPFDAFYSCAALGISQDWRTFMFADFFFWVDADDEDVAQGACLAQGVCMAEMHGIEAAIHEDADGAFRDAGIGRADE